MATQQLPSNLYSGYAQVVDTRPSLAFAARLHAQKQAREDALNKYFNDVSSKVTSTGMREQEVPALFQARDNYNRFWIQNKDALNKGDAKTWMKAKELQNVLLSIPETSKSEKSKSDDLQSMYLTHPELKAQMDEETDIPLIGAHEQPTHIVDATGNVVPNPNHASLDASKMSFNAKEYNVKDLDTHMTHRNTLFPMDAQRLSTKPNPDDKYSQITETTSFYTPKRLGAIAGWEKDNYNQDARARQTFDKAHNLVKIPVEDWKLEHMDEFDKYNSVYKSVTGKDIEGKDDLYAASQLLPLVDQSVTKSKPAINWATRNALTFEQHKKLIDRNKAAGIPPPNTGYLSDEVDEAVGEDVQAPKWESPRRVVYVDKVDPDRLNTIIGRDYSKKQLGVDPKVLQMEDGKYRDYYEVDPTTGDWIGKGEQRISREAAKDRYITKMSPTAFKSKIGTQAQEGKKAAPTTTNTNKTHKTKKGIIIPVFTK